MESVDLPVGAQRYNHMAGRRRIPEANARQLQNLRQPMEASVISIQPVLHEGQCFPSYLDEGFEVNVLIHVVECPLFWLLNIPLVSVPSEDHTVLLVRPRRLRQHTARAGARGLLGVARVGLEVLDVHGTIPVLRVPAASAMFLPKRSTVQIVLERIADGLNGLPVMCDARDFRVDSSSERRRRRHCHKHKARRHALGVGAC
mmetsp:Transcript_63300/g.159638  ORF Transcript_63300/g.159638 Transcript_63300/m.159638 type:complete len:202 (+) Transcript_63300:227-832(+)